MRQAYTLARFAIVAMVVLSIPFGMTFAEEEEGKKAWTDTAEFSYVATGGNSESSSLGLKNTTARNWENAVLTIRLGGFRAENTKVSRSAVDGVVSETETTEKTAEAYYLNGRYNRNITDKFFWYAGLGWSRNRFAGIENRTIADAGVGNTWWDREDLLFKTSYGITYTDQEDVVTVPGVKDTYAGLRLAWDYMNKWGKNTTYTNLLVLDDNLDETSDWRATMDQGLAVAMSKMMAIKIGLLMLYDNEPAFTLVDNVDGGGAPLDPVPYQLEELDTVFTVSLVVNWD